MPQHLLLKFALNPPSPAKPLRDGLSAVVWRENTLWLANDESVRLERLIVSSSGQEAAEHASFSLSEFLKLPKPSGADPEALEEADLEGLAWEEGYLWLTGSHSLKRKNPKPEDSPEKIGKKLAGIGVDGNRYLLARIPLQRDGGSWRPVGQDGPRHAAWVKGDALGNQLTDALKEDKHLAPFLTIPGKDNGFDIEGLAVADGRLFLGLRGPVLRGWAVILELELEETGEHHLQLRPLDGRPYLKHFLQMDGLGLRDLCRQGDDFLILAGPTMDLDGPIQVHRWSGGARRHDHGEAIPASRLPILLEIPHGRGRDRAEGVTLFEQGGAPALLVVYDASAETRKRGEQGVLADVFPLAREGG